MEAPTHQDTFVLIINDKINKMKVDILRKELRIRGLGRGGLEKYLIQRLEQAMFDKVSIETEKTSEVANATIFSLGTYWKVLKPEDKVIEYPTDGANLRAPTVDNNEVQMVKKRNYAEVFDREPFVGTVEVPSLNRFKQRCYENKEIDNRHKANRRTWTTKSRVSICAWFR